jgi:hypothetical protein
MFLLHFDLIFYQAMPRKAHLWIFFKCEVIYMSWYQRPGCNHVCEPTSTHSISRQHTRIRRFVNAHCWHACTNTIAYFPRMRTVRCVNVRVSVHVCVSHKQCVWSYHLHWDSCPQTPQHTFRQACLARQRVRNHASSMLNISWKTTLFVPSSPTGPCIRVTTRNIDFHQHACSQAPQHTSRQAHTQTHTQTHTHTHI